MSDFSNEYTYVKFASEYVCMSLISHIMSNFRPITFMFRLINQRCDILSKLSLIVFHLDGIIMHVFVCFVHYVYSYIMYICIFSVITNITKEL